MSQWLGSLQIHDFNQTATRLRQQSTQSDVSDSRTDEQPAEAISELNSVPKTEQQTEAKSELNAEVSSASVVSKESTVDTVDTGEHNDKTGDSHQHEVDLLSGTTSDKEYLETKS